MKLTENKLRKIIREEQKILREENTYDLTSQDLVKIVFGDAGRKIVSKIMQIGQTLGLTDTPIRQAKSAATYEGWRNIAKWQGKGPKQSAETLKQKLEKLGFDKNEAGQIRQAFADAAGTAAEVVKSRYSDRFDQNDMGIKDDQPAFVTLEKNFLVYTPSSVAVTGEAESFFYRRTRQLAKKKLEKLSFVN